MKWFRQTSGYCGPTSLRIALTKFGKEYSEADLAFLCKATRSVGTFHVDLISALEKIGIEAEDYRGGSIHDLKKAISDDYAIVVGWWKPAHYPPHDGEACDHFSVVSGISSNFVYLLDPEYEGRGRTRELMIPIKEFEELWYDFDDNEAKCERWYLIIKGEKEKMK